MRLVALSLIVVAALFLAALLGPSTAPFDPDNPYWSGYSTAASICLKPIWGTGWGNVSTVFVVAQRELPRELVEALKAFVEGGGRLVVLDGGAGNELLEELGLSSRFGVVTIEDPVLNVANEEFPIAVVLNTSLVATEARSIALGGATPIMLADKGAVPIAVTSPFSVAGNSTGPFVVAAAVPLGRGVVVLISSPTVFMNSLLSKADNARFLQDLCGGGAAYLLDGLSIGGFQPAARRILGEAYQAASSSPLGDFLAILPILAMSLILLRNGQRRGREQSSRSG